MRWLNKALLGVNNSRQAGKAPSLLLLASLLLLLFLSALHHVRMHLPHILDVLIVLLLGPLERWREQGHNVCVLMPVRPVGRTVAVLVAHVNISVFR